MAFDKKRAEQCIVEVCPAPRSRGMGFHMLGDGLIVTACHCLRRAGGRVLLPDPNALGSEPVPLKVRRFGARGGAPLLVRYADPCSDVAVLGTSTADGTDLTGSLSEGADELFSSLEPVQPELAAVGEVKVHLFTHERKWVTGKARGQMVQLDRREMVRPGTSGAPVFTEAGRVLGLVSFAAVRSPVVRMCLLADHLPGWLLRMAREFGVASQANVSGEAIPASLRKALERAIRLDGSSKPPSGSAGSPR